jgi:hypothetical protein
MPPSPLSKLDQKEKEEWTPKRQASRKKNRKAVIAIVSGDLKRVFRRCTKCAAFLSKSIPNKNKIAARSTAVRNQTYFPTMKGKRVEVETIINKKGVTVMKNFEILNHMNFNACI